MVHDLGGVVGWCTEGVHYSLLDGGSIHSDVCPDSGLLGIERGSPTKAR